MHKCHCGEVFFEEIIRHAEKSGMDPESAMDELGAGQICTACVSSFFEYYKMRDSLLVTA